jgi:hypothetical protein
MGLSKRRASFNQKMPSVFVKDALRFQNAGHLFYTRRSAHYRRHIFFYSFHIVGMMVSRAALMAAAIK